MKKRILIFTGIALVMLSLLTGLNSCNPNCPNPTTVHDTLYVHDTTHLHDTANCINCYNAVGCYPFSGNANDVSGNNLNGTVIGATLTTDRHGNANSAYYFNKSYTTRIELPSLSNFDNTNDFSISFWAKTDNVAGYGTTILSDEPNVSSDRFQININYSGSPVNTNIFDYGNISGGGRLVSPASSVVFSTWEHYVFVKSSTGNFMKIYKNGAEIATKAGVSTKSNKSKIIVVGGSPANTEHGDQFFKGSLDDLKIFNRALTVAEVTQIYNAER